MASPLYTAFAPLRTATSVTVDGAGPVAPTAGFQPSIPPFSEAKMNLAGPEWPAASRTTNPLASVLNTCPVGAPELICTTSAALVTDVAVAPWYSVVLSVPLSDTHSGDPGA